MVVHAAAVSRNTEFIYFDNLRISDVRILGDFIEIDVYALNRKKIAGIQLELNQTINGWSRSN